MTRVKCVVSYDGSNFNGFQIQNEARTVQEEIQLALFKIHQEKVIIAATGRTDRGVHALGQVFHFDTFLTLSEDEWKKALNSNLPNDIHIISAEFVSDSFHSRFDAKGKIYAYYLNAGEYNPLQRQYVYQYNRPLNVEAMNSAAQLFVGTHNYLNFCSNKESEVKDFIKTINSFEVTIKDDIICFRTNGSGFLRYMVRMMVGNLIEIGARRKGVEIITSRLDSKQINTTSYNAPSEGLYLEKVEY